MYSDELKHFGVKGMRWGVRKKREAHPESSRAWKKQRAYELSDRELNRRINRVQQERRYSEITRSTPRRVASNLGKTIFVTILAAAATEAVKGIVRKDLTLGAMSVENSLKNFGKVNIDEIMPTLK